VALAGESKEVAAQVAALCAPPGEVEAITAQNPAPDAGRAPPAAPAVDCQLERALQLLHGRVALTRS
jgi:hypothetical protein